MFVMQLRKFSTRKTPRMKPAMRLCGYRRAWSPFITIVEIAPGLSTKFDPSYFVIQTGPDNASLLIWPGGHHVAAEFERFTDACKAKEPNSGLLVHNKRTLQTYEKRLSGELKPQQVNIYHFSAFIGRGDLVHAGDVYNGPEPTIRNHVYCPSMSDMLANIIFIRPFGNQFRVKLSSKMHIYILY
jgi:hypothetical protein